MYNECSYDHLKQKYHQTAGTKENTHEANPHIILNNVHHLTGLNEEQRVAVCEDNGPSDRYIFVNYNQEKATDHDNHSLEYGAKNCLKQDNSTIDNEWYSPGYAKVGNLEVVSKTVVVIEEKENPSAQHNEPHRKEPIACIC